MAASTAGEPPKVQRAGTQLRLHTRSLDDEADEDEIEAKIPEGEHGELGGDADHEKAEEAKWYADALATASLADAGKEKLRKKAVKSFWSLRHFAHLPIHSVRPASVYGAERILGLIQPGVKKLPTLSHHALALEAGPDPKKDGNPTYTFIVETLPLNPNLGAAKMKKALPDAIGGKHVRDQLDLFAYRVERRTLLAWRGVKILGAFNGVDHAKNWYKEVLGVRLEDNWDSCRDPTYAALVPTEEEKGDTSKIPVFPAAAINERLEKAEPLQLMLRDLVVAVQVALNGVSAEVPEGDEKASGDTPTSAPIYAGINQERAPAAAFVSQAAKSILKGKYTKATCLTSSELTAPNQELAFFETLTAVLGGKADKQNCHSTITVFVALLAFMAGHPEEYRNQLYHQYTAVLQAHLHGRGDF